MAKKGTVLNIPKLSKTVIENKPAIIDDEKAADDFVKRAPVAIKPKAASKKQEKGRVRVASFSVPESLLDRLDEYVASMHYKKKVKISKSEFVSEALDKYLVAKSGDN